MCGEVQRRGVCWTTGCTPTFGVRHELHSCERGRVRAVPAVVRRRAVQRVARVVKRQAVQERHIERVSRSQLQADRKLEAPKSDG